MAGVGADRRDRFGGRRRRAGNPEWRGCSAGDHRRLDNDRRDDDRCYVSNDGNEFGGGCRERSRYRGVYLVSVWRSGAFCNRRHLDHKLGGIGARRHGGNSREQHGAGLAFMSAAGCRRIAAVYRRNQPVLRALGLSTGRAGRRAPGDALGSPPGETACRSG